jgi:hypothetical protein
MIFLLLSLVFLNTTVFALHFESPFSYTQRLRDFIHRFVSFKKTKPVIGSAKLVVDVV